MKVIYIGKSGNHFTHGYMYEVDEIDSDGDYIMRDDFKNLINEYKSKFIVVSEQQ